MSDVSVIRNRPRTFSSPMRLSLVNLLSARFTLPKERSRSVAIRLRLRLPICEAAMYSSMILYLCGAAALRSG